MGRGQEEGQEEVSFCGQGLLESIVAARIWESGCSSSFQGNTDGTANEQEYVVAIKEITDRCRKAILEMVEELAERKPASKL